MTDQELRLRAEKEVFTVRPETEQKIRQALLKAQLDPPRVRASMRRGWVLGIAVALLLCAAALALTVSPARDETTLPLTQGTEEPLVTPVPQPTGEAAYAQAVFTDWQPSVGYQTVTFTTTVNNQDETPAYVAWEPLMDPLVDAQLAQPPMEGLYVPAGQQAQDQAVYYVQGAWPSQVVLSIRWTQYQLLVPIYREEAWMPEDAEQQSRLEQAVMDGQIAVVGHQLALSDSFAQAYQQSPLAYYVDHGMMQAQEGWSDREMISSSFLPKTVDDSLLQSQPLTTVPLDGCTARLLQADRMDTAPCLALDLQFDSLEAARSCMDKTQFYLLRRMDKRPLANEAGFVSVSGGQLLQAQDGACHVVFVTMQIGSLTRQDWAAGLALVPTENGAANWDGAIPLPEDKTLAKPAAP